MGNHFKRGLGLFAFVSVCSTTALANISGYVKNLSSEGVSGVSVTLQSSGYSSNTDVNGYFSIETGDSSISALSSNIVSSVSFEGLNLQFFTGKTAPVSISTYGALGQSVYHNDLQVMAGGFHSVNVLPQNANPGLYIVKVEIGGLEYTYKVNFFGARKGSRLVETNVLRKKVAVADTLVLQYEGSMVSDKIPVYDDDLTIDDIILSRKLVRGIAGDAPSVSVFLQSSLGQKISLESAVSNGSYGVSSVWMIYNADRKWNVSASAAGAAPVWQLNVDDAAQQITLDLNAVNSSSSFFPIESSSSESSSSQINSSSNANSSSSVSENRSSSSNVNSSSAASGPSILYLNYSAELDASSTEYSYVTVNLGKTQVANALGIPEAKLSDVTYFAVNPDGSENSSPSTANAPGHWFDENGNIVTYGSGDAAVYSELNLSSMTANVGQYPGKLTGKSYTVKQGVSYDYATVIFTITLNMKSVEAPGSSSSSAKSSSSGVSSSSVKSSSSMKVSSSSISSSSSSSHNDVSSSSVAATTITMASLQTSNPEIYKFVNWQWDYRLSSKGIVSGSDGTYDDYRTENSPGLTFEHIIKGKGTLKYCVIWEKKSALSKTKRDQIRQMLIDITHAWTKYLTGFEGWPYDNVSVIATGWAVYDASYIQDRQSDEVVYTSIKNDDMVGAYYTLNFGGNTQPYCADGTYDEVFQVVDGYTEYSTNMWGFAGGGLWVAAEHVENSLGNGIPHIVAHESGHNFGLPDYYETWDFPDANYSSPKAGNAADGGITAKVGYAGVSKPMVMNAGSSSTVTEYDYWLLRKFWYETKHKFGY